MEEEEGGGGRIQSSARQSIWAAARMNTFGGRIKRAGLAVAAEIRQVSRIRLTTERPARILSSLGRRYPP